MTLYDIYLELMPARCTILSNEDVGNRGNPDSDEEFEGESFSVALQGTLRRTRRSLRSGEGSISEAPVPIPNQQEKDGRVRRGQIQAAVEEKMFAVQIHNSEEKEAAAAVDDAAKAGDPKYFETSL